MKNILCKIGFHKWLYTKDKSIRKCIRVDCGRFEKYDEGMECSAYARDDYWYKIAPNKNIQF